MPQHWDSTPQGETSMDCQEVEELLGAYALDALSEEERKEVDIHLAECPKCARTVKQLQEIVDLFPLSVPPVNPPERLKTQVLDRIKRSSQTVESPSNGDNELLVRRTRRRYQRSVGTLATIAAMLLLLLGGMLVWNLSLRQQIAQRPAPTSLVQPVAYQLHGSSSATSDVSGDLLYFPQQHITVLTLHNLPQLTGTHVYQGWLIQNNQPHSLGLLNVSNGEATLEFPGDIKGYDATAISLEKGPLASPTIPKGPVIAQGSLKPD